MRLHVKYLLLPTAVLCRDDDVVVVVVVVAVGVRFVSSSSSLSSHVSENSLSCLFSRSCSLLSTSTMVRNLSLSSALCAQQLFINQ